ncbi:MAG: serine hydrolase [Actinomycetota bacterium]
MTSVALAAAYLLNGGSGAATPAAAPPADSAAGAGRPTTGTTPDYDSSKTTHRTAPEPTEEPRSRSVSNPFTSAAVAHYLAGLSSIQLTAAVYDANTGRTFTYNPSVSEDTASIMKVDILATLLAKNEATNSYLTDEQVDLTKAMIEASDDNSAQDIWDDLGGASAVAAFNSSLGMTHTVPDAEGYWGLSTTTAADQVRLLQDIAYPNSILNDASRAYTQQLMETVDPDQVWGVSDGPPSGVTVAIKNGWLPLADNGNAAPWQVNSLGIVSGDGANYCIAVMTDEAATEQQGINAIQGLSALLWPELDHGP